MLTKDELITHFGSQSDFARFMEQSRASASQLPDQITKEYLERVVGVLTLKEEPVPSSFRKAWNDYSKAN